jgi:plasmid replication initiation protein
MVTDKQVKNKMQKLDKNNWIVRTNALNEMRDNNMTLTEMRLFAIYQSKINPHDSSSRKVEFELAEFERIMEIKRANVTVLEQIGRRIVTRTAIIHEEDGGFSIMPLFGKFKLYKRADEMWCVELDSHYEMLPYLFEFKERFFKYELWNALRLKSTNQQRMYEVLKQYEYAKATEISIDILKALIGISQKQYTAWYDFKRNVLDICQKELAEHTDIKFTYEPIKRGKGGKVVALKFYIKKNNEYVDQLTLSEFIDSQPEPAQEDVSQDIQELQFENENIEFLADACKYQFTEEQMLIIKSYLIKIIPYENETSLNDQYDYLLKKYNELKYREKRTDLAPLKNRFAYLKSLFEIEVKNMGEDDETKW